MKIFACTVLCSAIFLFAHRFCLLPLLLLLFHYSMIQQSVCHFQYLGRCTAKFQYTSDYCSFDCFCFVSSKKNTGNGSHSTNQFCNFALYYMQFDHCLLTIIRTDSRRWWDTAYLCCTRMNTNNMDECKQNQSTT